MSGDLVGGLGIAALACLLGMGGIFVAIRRYRRRAAIASTYGQTGGIAYTVVQAGCSGLLFVGGVTLLLVVLLVRR